MSIVGLADQFRFLVEAVAAQPQVPVSYLVVGELTVPVALFIGTVIAYAVLWGFPIFPVESDKQKFCHEQCEPAPPVAEVFADAPNHPHLELVMNPSQGIFYSNPQEAAAFENECAKGVFLCLHRATYDKGIDASGDYEFGSYFQGKKRLWEARFQFQFKRPVESSEMFFGIELDQYVPMNAVTKGAMETIISILKRTVGDQIYHSPGDDPRKVDGELERPAFVMPLWAYDQIIVTPKGEEPPRLTTPDLSSLGIKRHQRVSEYRKEVDGLRFEVGPTYTFCFWGISQFLDVIKWELCKIPFITPANFNNFCGRPPVNIVNYTLKEKGREKRHLNSRKNYFLNLRLWSSEKRPGWDQINAFLGGSSKFDTSRLAKPSSGGWWENLVPCCGSR